MTPPTRIQRRRTKGFKLQEQSPDGRPVVSVTRPGEWGNPFEVGIFYKIGDGACRGEMGYIMCREEKYANPSYKKIETVEQAVQAHREYLEKYPPKNIGELRGKHLACFCKIGEPCHADTLLKLSNQ